jgi:hypothetical protein
MSADGVRIAIACEDQAHRSLATSLADRVLLDEALQRSAGWIDESSLPWLRTYCGRGDTGQEPEHLRFYDLSRARKDAEDLGNLLVVGGRPVKLRGFIDGKPLRPEAGYWRRVLLLFATLDPPPHALIVLHDTDGDQSRLSGLEQALALQDVFPVVIGAPHQDADAWFVAGFVPRDAAEKRRLEERKDELGFYPPDEPHRLTAHPNDARTDAKRVLRILVFDENASRPPSLEELPDLCSRTLGDLAVLQQRGEGCQLADFLRMLRATLPPLLIPGASLR